ncbi:MAG: hypothetical protein WKG07_24640 [Hymenobacter sp.]
MKVWSHAAHRFVDTGQTFCGLLDGRPQQGRHQHHVQYRHRGGGRGQHVRRRLPASRSSRASAGAARRASKPSSCNKVTKWPSA